MTVAMMPEQTWTAERMVTALVHINTALASLKRNPDGPVDNQTVRAIDEARQLEPLLGQNPPAYMSAECRAAALACCSRLLETRMV